MFQDPLDLVLHGQKGAAQVGVDDAVPFGLR